MSVAIDKEVDAGIVICPEESPGTIGQRCRLTAGQGNLKDSVTENKPLHRSCFLTNKSPRV